MSLLKSYVYYWKNTFNVKQSINKKEFSSPIMINILLIFVLLPLLTKLLGKDLFIIANFWNVYIATCSMSVIWGLITMIPNFSLFYRRLNALHKEAGMAILYTIAPILLFVWFFFVLILGQGLPPNTTWWNELIFMTILFAPVIYYVYKVVQLMIQKSPVQ